MENDMSPRWPMGLSCEPSGRRPSGFTLVELMVVVAIIGLLMALLVPAVGGAREAARRSQCLNNLKQLGIAAQGYERSRGTFPPCVEAVPSANDASWGWLALMLPYIEQQVIYDKLRVGDPAMPLETMIATPATNPDLVPIALQPISAFLCPTFGMPTRANDGNFDKFKISAAAVSPNQPFAPAHYAASFGVASKVSNPISWNGNAVNTGRHS